MDFIGSCTTCHFMQRPNFDLGKSSDCIALRVHNNFWRSYQNAPATHAFDECLEKQFANREI